MTGNTQPRGLGVSSWIRANLAAARLEHDPDLRKRLEGILAREPETHTEEENTLLRIYYLPSKDLFLPGEKG